MPRSAHQEVPRIRRTLSPGDNYSPDPEEEPDSSQHLLVETSARVEHSCAHQVKHQSFAVHSSLIEAFSGSGLADDQTCPKESSAAHKAGRIYPEEEICIRWRLIP